MTFALARSLLLADAVERAALARALLEAMTRRTSLVSALLATRAVAASELERHLERIDAPVMRQIVPVPTLVQKLPPGLCERLLALPVRVDPRTSTVDVAVVDASDPHPAEEIGYWLKAPVRLVRTPLPSMEAALRGLRVTSKNAQRAGSTSSGPISAPVAGGPSASGAPPMRDRANTPLYGTPAIESGAPNAGQVPAGSTQATPELREPRAGPRRMQTKAFAAPVLDLVFEPLAEGKEQASIPGQRAAEAAASDPTASSFGPAAEPVLDLVRRKTIAPRSTLAPTASGSNAASPYGILGAPSAPSAPSGAGGAGGPGEPVASVASAEAREPDSFAVTRRGPFLTATPAAPSFPDLGPSGAPFQPNAPSPPFADIAPILEAVRTAGDRDTILDLIVSGTRTVARRVAVLAVRRDAIVGWTCSPEFGERVILKGVRLMLSVPTVMHHALQGDAAYLTRLPKDGTHASLIGAMRRPPAGELAVVAVFAEGKPVAIVIADELGDTLTATQRLDQLAQAGGAALARLLHERRR